MNWAEKMLSWFEGDFGGQKLRDKANYRAAKAGQIRAGLGWRMGLQRPAACLVDAMRRFWDGWERLGSYLLGVGVGGSEAQLRE